VGDDAATAAAVSRVMTDMLPVLMSRPPLRTPPKKRKTKKKIKAAAAPALAVAAGPVSPVSAPVHGGCRRSARIVY
jgi:hypothetical protein